MRKLITILLILISFAVKAQYTPNAGAYQYKGLKQTNSLQPPSTSGMPVTLINAPDSNYAALYYNKADTTWYGFNPVTKTWSPFASGGGGSSTRDTAHLNQGFGLLILNDDSTYKPNGQDVTIAWDSLGSKDFIISLVNGDTTIINNSDSIPALIVDTISKTPPASAGEGYKVIVGSASNGTVICTGLTGVFVGHCGDIAEKVGSVWVFTTPECNQQVIVDNSLAYSTWQYKCPSNVWRQTSVLWRVNGNSGIGTNAFLGRRDKQPLFLRAWNLNVMKLDTTRDVYLPKWSGLQGQNIFFKPGLNGKIDTGHFNIPVYASPAISDSIMYVQNGAIKYGTASGAGGGTPSGNYGNVQLNRNSTFATPASDSLSFNSAALTIKGGLNVTGNAKFAGNGTPASGKVPTGTDASGNWTWQTPTTTTTDKQDFTLTASQVNITITGLPSSTNDFDIFYNYVYLPNSFYSEIGTTLTLTAGAVAGDHLSYTRKK